MTPPRIGMFTTFYPPYNFGGDGIGISRLATALARRGAEVTVIHDRDAYLSLAGKEPAPAADHGPVKVVPLRRQGLLSPLITQQTGQPGPKRRELASLIEAGQFDVLWYHNLSLIGGPGLLAMGQGIKLVEAHEHWLICPTHVLWKYNRERCETRECLRCQLSYKRPPQLWRHTGLLERNLGHVDRVIAKSEFSRARHAQFGFPREMEVVPYFLPDLDHTAVEPHAEERPYFLFVGRLEKIKGVQDVLPAFAGEGAADLLIVGSGTYEAELRAQAAGMPRVKFAGAMPPDRVSAYYRGAEALLVPSVCYETFGIILIEAFRLGTPVIARNLGPFPEIVTRAGGGMLFDDAPGLAALMARFEADPGLRDRLRGEARRSFEKHWQEDVVVQQYCDVIGGAALDRGNGAVMTALEQIA